MSRQKLYIALVKIMFGLQCLVTHLFYCDFHNSVESRLPSACLKLRFGLISEHTCSLGRLTPPLERELEFTPVLCYFSSQLEYCYDDIFLEVLQ